MHIAMVPLNCVYPVSSFTAFVLMHIAMVHREFSLAMYCLGTLNCIFYQFSALSCTLLFKKLVDVRVHAAAVGIILYI